MEDCLFCMIAEGKIPSKKLYEDEMCIRDSPGGVLAGQAAGGTAELVQQGVKGRGLCFGGGDGVVQRKAGTALECLDLAADEAVQHCRSHRAHQNQTQQNDQRRTQTGALFVGRRCV